MPVPPSHAVALAGSSLARNEGGRGGSDLGETEPDPPPHVDERRNYPLPLRLLLHARCRASPRCCPTATILICCPGFTMAHFNGGEIEEKGWGMRQQPARVGPEPPVRG